MYRLQAYGDQSNNVPILLHILDSLDTASALTTNITRNYTLIEGVELPLLLCLCTVIPVFVRDTSYWAGARVAQEVPRPGNLCAAVIAL